MEKCQIQSKYTCRYIFDILHHQLCIITAVIMHKFYNFEPIHFNVITNWKNRRLIVKKLNKHDEIQLQKNMIG